MYHHRDSDQHEAMKLVVQYDTRTNSLVTTNTSQHHLTMTSQWMTTTQQCHVMLPSFTANDTVHLTDVIQHLWTYVSTWLTPRCVYYCRHFIQTDCAVKHYKSLRTKDIS